MGRHNTAVTHSYGTDSDMSFGELLVKCLSFPRAELEADYGNSLEAGNEVQPTTLERVEKAKAAKVKQDIGMRLHQDKFRAA